MKKEHIIENKIQFNDWCVKNSDEEMYVIIPEYFNKVTQSNNWGTFYLCNYYYGAKGSIKDGTYRIQSHGGTPMGVIIIRPEIFKFYYRRGILHKLKKEDL